MAPFAEFLIKRSKDSNPDAIDTLNNKISAANYVGLGLTILVMVVLLGTIVYSVRKRRLRKAQEEIRKQTGESFSISEMKQMKAASTPGRSDFSPGRILGI